MDIGSKELGSIRRKLGALLAVLLVSSLLFVIHTPTASALPSWWVNKVIETGGNGPQYGASGWSAKGTGCTTKSYSTMVGAQGKVNSCYVYRVDGLSMYYAEAGWIWMGTESGAPLHFMATVNNSGPQYLWYIDWFTPGTSHHYRIRSVGSGNWGVWVDYNYKGAANAGFQYGWSTVAGERYNCGGNAEFTYCEKYNGSTWSAWTQPTDWDWGVYDLDTDSSYRFIRKASNIGWIRPGSG